LRVTQALNVYKALVLNLMARGRIIDAVISQSRKVNSVSDQAALLFTWIQAHTDDYGRIEGESEDIMFLVVPRRGWNAEQVESYLKELWEIGLLKKYQCENGKRYFEVYAFNEHQIFRSDRGRKEKYPIPTEFDNQWYTTDTQVGKLSSETKLSISKVKLSKVKVKSKGATGKPVTTHAKVEEVVKTITPKEKAGQFFSGVESLKNKQDVPWLQEFLNAIAQKNNNVSKAAIWNEIKAFANYWTELTHTGLKQRWECQKTFEVERRLITWFARAGFKDFNSTGSFARSDKGKNIIGLDEDENAN